MPRSKTERVERRYIFIIALLIAGIIILSNVLFMFYNRSFYYNEYKTLGLYGLTPPDKAKYATENLLDYLTGKTASLNDFFSETERLHLKDVKNLIILLKIKIIALVALTAALIYLFHKHQKKRKFKHFKAEFQKSILNIFIVQGIIMFFILVIAFIFRDSFESMFITMHQMLFSNNYWMLDPAVDKLILLLPQSFFVHATAAIFIRSFIISAILLVIALAAKKIFFKD